MTKNEKKAKYYRAKANKAYKLAAHARAKGNVSKHQKYMRSFARFDKAAKHFEKLVEQQAHRQVATTRRFRSQSHATASTRRAQAIARNIEATRRLQRGNRGAKVT